MFSFFKRKASAPATAMNPRQVHELLARDAIVLIDVREPAEFAAERIAGAVNIPLSRFERGIDRLPQGKEIVLHCLSGARSGRALAVCAARSVSVTTHMAGGIKAWKAAGLPTTS